MTFRLKILSYLSLTLPCSLNLSAQDHSATAFGPNGKHTTTTASVPTSWSVSTGKNILWKTELPEGGQSGITVWGDRVFLSVNQPLPPNYSKGEAASSEILACCLDANSGKILWTAPIKGTKEVLYSGLFSDATSPTPVTDGKHVWFVNAAGGIACFDMDGKKIWGRNFEVRSRHRAKQAEPILFEDQLLYLGMLDPDDPKRRPMKAIVGDRKSNLEDWPRTFIRSFKKSDGSPLWAETSGTSVHCTPRIGYLNGKPYLYHARGGGHKPPETPYGVSMTHLTGKDVGKPLWAYQSPKLYTYNVPHFNDKYAVVIEDENLTKLNSSTGAVISKIPLFKQITLNLWDEQNNVYVKKENADFSQIVKKYKKFPTHQTGIIVGKYYLYLSFEENCVVRVNLDTESVEYLQVPVQIVRSPSKPEQTLWNKHIPSKVSNAKGITFTNDSRSEGSGWGHVTCGIPTVINNKVYFSTMIGMTYVIDSQVETFDASALISINDLGPAGNTWSLSSPTYANGKIYHRGQKYLVCIKKKSQ